MRGMRSGQQLVTFASSMWKRCVTSEKEFSGRSLLFDHWFRLLVQHLATFSTTLFATVPVNGRSFWYC